MSVQSPAIVTDEKELPSLPTDKPALYAFFAGRLPLPPGINGSYRPGTADHPIIGTKALHQFKADAAQMLSQGYHDWSIINAIHKTRLNVALRMDIHFFFKTLWKQDIDGGVKAVIDAVFTRLNHTFDDNRFNDNTVVDLHVKKREDSDDPRVEIELYCSLLPLPPSR